MNPLNLRQQGSSFSLASSNHLFIEGHNKAGSRKRETAASAAAPVCATTILPINLSLRRVRDAKSERLSGFGEHSLSFDRGGCGDSSRVGFPGCLAWCSYQNKFWNMFQAAFSAANVVSVTNMVNATTCANAKIPKGQNTKIPTCQNVKMSKCPNAKMSKGQNVKMTKCQNDKVPKAKIPKCYTALLNWTLQMTEAIGVHHRRRKNTVCYRTPLAHLVPSAWLEGEPVWVYVCVRPDVEALGSPP